MKCQILFSGKNKKTIINLLSAEFAQNCNVPVTIAADTFLIFFFFFFFFSDNKRLDISCE